jgi:hypothetical protein
MIATAFLRTLLAVSGLSSSALASTWELEPTPTLIGR